MILINSGEGFMGSVGASIVEGPGEVSWVGRNSATKVLKNAKCQEELRFSTRSSNFGAPSRRPWVSLVPRVAAGRRHIEKREDLGEEVGRRLSAWRKQNQALCWNLFEQQNIAGNRL